MPIVAHCPNCNALVHGKELGTFERGYDPEIDEYPWNNYRLILLQCMMCEEPLLIQQDCTAEYIEDGEEITEWGAAQRLWPPVSEPLSIMEKFPPSIRFSISEARRCLSGNAYTASVAMTGRALEAVARYFHKGTKPEKLMLSAGIDELHKNKVIDDRLYEWGKELHLNRNLAAHDSGQKFEQADAEDLFNFAVSICEYVFVLSVRFETFKKRRQSTPTEETSK